MAGDLDKVCPQTLVWSLDGALRYLSPAALHDGSQYLAERYEHVVITLASRTRLPDERSPDWRGAGFGVSIIPERDRYLFDPLPAVPEELRSVIRNAGTPMGSGVIPGETALNREFTRATFEKALARTYPVIHVASHFAISAGGDRRSYLLLGDGERLSLETIRTSPIFSFKNVDLLTLSACNTGVGRADAAGSEVEGFAMIAQERGAKAIIASLWRVADPSTAQFMRAFYQAAARDGLTKAAALRRAQLALLQPVGDVRAATSLGSGRDAIPAHAPVGQSADPNGRVNFTPDPRARYAHPYFWAPFVLIGNWR